MSWVVLATGAQLIQPDLQGRRFQGDHMPAKKTAKKATKKAAKKKK
jgi:hypothetical protein